MKKLSVLLVAAISLSMAFSSCKKDEPEQTKWDIDAKVENGSELNSQIDSVFALIDINDRIVGRAKFENGGFKMNLDAVSPDDMTNIVTYFSSSVTVSDKTVNITELEDEILYATKNNKFAGTLFLTNISLADILNPTFKGTIGKASYFYVDKDVKVNGTETYSNSNITYKYTYNLNLKAGWNLVAINETSSETSIEIATVSLTSLNGYKWYFFPSLEE